MSDCNDLIKKYPKLYGDPDPEGERKHYMQDGGFECGDGWFKLLDKLSAKIQAYLKENPIEGFYVQQVKSKFGGLRYYTSVYNEDIMKLISQAESEAFDTYEYLRE